MNENENKEVIVKTKTSKGVIVLLIILIIAVLGLSAYVVYDKLGKKNDIKEEKSKEDNKQEENTSKEEDFEQSKTLSGSIYYLTSDKDRYISFINDTDYEFYHYGDNAQIVNTKGKYTYDGTNISLDNNTKILVNGDILYIRDNDFIDYVHYNLYFKSIDEEFKKIGNAAATARLNEWNADHSTKMTKTESSVYSCYDNDTNSDVISCGVDIKQYFDNYDQNVCKNDSSSEFFVSIISSGECESSYSTNWYFTSVERNNDSYKTSGSWTGM